MISRAVGINAVDESTERYRRAEHAVWRHYGLAPTERFVDVAAGEVRLRVQEVGTGEPIVFVHGGLWPSTGLAGLIRELPGYRCIVIDRPGAGLSSPIDWRKRDVGTVATQIMGDVIDALGIELTHVIGHSVGGAWALRLALGRPDRVGRIVILGAAPILPEMPRPTFLRVLASPLGALMARLPQNQDRARDMLRQDGHGPTLDAGNVPEVLFDWHVALVRETRTMLNERAMIRDAVIRGSSWRPGLTFVPAQLATVSQPLLYVIGTADPEGSVEYAKRVVGQLPHAELHIVADAGHLVWLDDATGVGNAIRSFLDSSAARSSPGAGPGTTPRHDRS